MPIDFKTAEAQAPRMTDGVLPRTVSTLEFIPAEKWPQYARATDGTFRLDWVHAGDMKNYDPAEIGSGKVRIIPVGETPQTLAAAAEASAIAQRQFADAMTSGAAAQVEANAADRKATADRRAAEQAWRSLHGL